MTGLVTVPGTPADTDAQEFLQIANTSALAGLTFSGADSRLITGTITPSNEICWRAVKLGLISSDYLVFKTANSNERMRIDVSGNTSITAQTTVCSAIATPAGGSTTARLLFGTTGSFGVYYGSGVPTVSAAQGSLYLRSDGSSTTTRMYVNTNGSTGWTAVTTSA